jgi:hypothetical protein
VRERQRRVVCTNWANQGSDWLVPVWASSGERGVCTSSNPIDLQQLEVSLGHNSCRVTTS